MDIFSEQLVVRQRNKKDIVIIAGIIALTAILSVLFTLFVPEPFRFLLVCGTWFGAWWLITNNSTEFEYIITSTILDVDKIMAKRSRKRLLSLDLKDAESFIAAEDLKDSAAKIIDATPNGVESGVYAIDYTKNGERMRLLFKPDAETMHSVKMACPSLLAFIKEDIEEQN